MRRIGTPPSRPPTNEASTAAHPQRSSRVRPRAELVANVTGVTQGEDPTFESKVLDWVETSGRALELRTARAFAQRQSARLVQQSVPYEDTHTKTQREGDVRALFHTLTQHQSVSIEVAVECKFSKQQPWVAFYDDRVFVPDDADAWFLKTPHLDEDLQADFVREWKSSDSLRTDRVATHVVSAFGSDSKKNFAHDAALQALSFAKAQAKGATMFTGDPPHLSAAAVVVPLVVTQAPLFSCELTKAGEVSLRQVERFDVWLYKNRVTRHRIYVRSEAGLRDMAEGFEHVIGHIS